MQFYGLPFAKTSSLWYITEGEPKGLFASNALSTPVVTLPGVNSYSLILDDGVLSQMKELGMKMVVVALMQTSFIMSGFYRAKNHWQTD